MEAGRLARDFASSGSTEWHRTVVLPILRAAPGWMARHSAPTTRQGEDSDQDARVSYFFLPFFPPAFLAGAFLLLRLLPPTWRSLRATSPSPSR
jgi:hypothetical protein